MQYVFVIIISFAYLVCFSNSFLQFPHKLCGFNAHWNVAVRSRKERLYSLIQESFEDGESRSYPLVVEFYANWCGPCRMLEKVLHEIGDKFSNHLKLACVDVEKEEDRAALFEIQALPTLIVLYDNLIVDKLIGYRDAEMLTNELENSLGKIQIYKNFKESNEDNATTNPL